MHAHTAYAHMCVLASARAHTHTHTHTIHTHTHTHFNLHRCMLTHGAHKQTSKHARTLMLPHMQTHAYIRTHMRART